MQEWIQLSDHEVISAGGPLDIESMISKKIGTPTGRFWIIQFYHDWVNSQYNILVSFEPPDGGRCLSTTLASDI